jgi:hypothetical protein
VKKLIVAIIVIWSIVIAAGIVVGVVLVTGDDDNDGDGDGSADPTSSTPSESGPTSEGPAGDVPAGLESFYGQQVEWEACGADQCGTLEVPLDYAEPDGETIEIALEMAPATGDRIGSMVVNPGGGGGGGAGAA